MTSVPKINAEVIVFYQGNTLVMDPFPTVMDLQKEYFCEAFREYGLQIGTSQICDEWVKANRVVDYPYIGHFFQEEPIVQHTLRNLGVQAEIAAFLALELLRLYRAGLKQVVSSDPETQEVAGALRILKDRGKRLGVFSNDRIMGLGLMLSVMRIKSFFEYAETSESIGFEKPDPKVFEHILDYFKTKPGRVVYVGDDPVRDMDPAKKAGLITIQYKIDVKAYNERWRDYRIKPEYEPDAIIDSFSQLIDIIE